MPREGAFQVEGVIAEVLPNGTYWIELANGHRLTGFVPGKAKQTFAASTGARVRVELSAYDLSKGRILVDSQS